VPSYEEIYGEHADRYDELVRHEDHQGNLALLLDRALVPRPRLAVELGCGTGRVTRLLAQRALAVRAYDGAPHMVDFARASVAAQNVTFGTADNASIPEPDGVADLVVAGWTIGHLTGFHPDSWREHAKRVLHEMGRVRAEHGTIVILETLGTCVDAPAPPNERLAALYELFERELSLVREVIATAYAFATPEEAARVMGFFFGPKMAAAVEARRDRVVPEWTGAWIGPVPR
jgi:ubiquinone/menaquinone biosynthesis C-methylase UbiE